MTLRIDDPEIDSLAFELAQREGTSVAEAVGRALRDRRAALDSDQDERDRRIRTLLAEIHAMPVLDPTPPDEMLYDRDGLPR